MGIFTGDFVFVGSIGRPDLLETAAGVVGSAEKGARQLYHSIERFRNLPNHLQVWPAHGAGSARAVKGSERFLRRQLSSKSSETDPSHDQNHLASP
jgi:glyoxylase-like metal-dependent hydrolase (beta-lactamase superfamily II)